MSIPPFYSSLHRFVLMNCDFNMYWSWCFHEYMCSCGPVMLSRKIVDHVEWLTSAEQIAENIRSFRWVSSD